jgi:hypothetical protein
MAFNDETFLPKSFLLGSPLDLDAGNRSRGQNGLQPASIEGELPLLETPDCARLALARRIVESAHEQMMRRFAAQPAKVRQVDINRVGSKNSADVEVAPREALTKSESLGFRPKLKYFRKKNLHVVCFTAMAVVGHHRFGLDDQGSTRID